jgi:plasmid maintenance system antidote protein VapI
MELDYYLFKNKMKIKDFAEKIGIFPHNVSRIVNRKVTPHLVIAIKIHKATDGLVSYEEMVGEKDRLNA